MGYACPICSDPQADAGHLANHLAFTAMLGDDDHEAWLDDHVPGWDEMGEADLADELAGDLESTEFPQLFEDTAGGLESNPREPHEERSGALFEDGEGTHHDHTHGSERDHGHPSREPIEGIDGGPTDEETAEILEEARELTREMLDGTGEPDTEDGGNAEEEEDDGRE
jgi:hypothetical protein